MFDMFIIWTWKGDKVRFWNGDEWVCHTVDARMYDEELAYKTAAAIQEWFPDYILDVMKT